VQRPSGLIKVEGSASDFRGSYLGLGRECFIEANISKQPKLLSDTLLHNGLIFSVYFKILFWVNLRHLPISLKLLLNHVK
jgi:hypothetical protein